MKEFTDEMDREVTFKNRLESFKKNVKDYFEYDYKNKNGGEDPWEICLIRDGYRIASQAEELINRQKAEIERLEKVRKRQAQFLDEERGQKYELYNVIAKTKSKALTEFAERLKAISDSRPLYDELVYIDEIEEVVKEMTEEEK